MLNDKQREMVTVNHNLIYGFLKKYHLDVEEWYGDAAIGLCKAAETFDESKATFGAYSYKCMFNEVMCEKRRRRSQYMIPEDELVYYETECSNDAGDTCTILDQLASDTNLEETVESNTAIGEIMDKLNDDEKTVLILTHYGYTQNIISERIGCSQRVVSKIKSRVAKKLAA